MNKKDIAIAYAIRKAGQKMSNGGMVKKIHSPATEKAMMSKEAHKPTKMRALMAKRMAEGGIAEDEYKPMDDEFMPQDLDEDYWADMPESKLDLGDDMDDADKQGSFAAQVLKRIRR